MIDRYIAFTQPAPMHPRRPPANLHPETLRAVNAQTRHEREVGGVVNIKKPGTNLGLLMETMGSCAAAVRAGRSEGLSADLTRLAARALGWAERLDEAQVRAMQRAARKAAAGDADLTPAAPQQENNGTP